ncbi:hypothetical protein ACG0Z5_17390 [Scandinavium sp. M-37]|uniref:hypothetical protein n=1 Tax=Scandinavium sp. M-37 TaxID=3373077 RepID=UPI00374744C1
MNTSLLHIAEGTFRYTLPSSTWTVMLIFLYDAIMAMLGKSSEYMRELYRETMFDLSVLMALFLYLFILYHFAGLHLTNSSTEISMAGFGLLAFGNVALLKLFTFKIGRQKYPKAGAFWIFAFTGSLSAYLLYENILVAQGDYNLIQSLWMQVTIFSVSLTVYFIAKHITFYAKKQRVEISPVISALATPWLVRLGLPHSLEEIAELWNKEAQKEKAKYRQEKKRKRKSNKKQ